MKRENKRTRRALLIAVLALVVCVATIGGTVAWLTASTDTVQNTFSPSNIGLTLVETGTGDVVNGVAPKSYKMIPGEEYTKDPKVTITNDVEAWLFVEIEKSSNIDTYLTYTIDETGWTKGSGDVEGEGKGVPTNVLYRKVAAQEVGASTSWYLLEGDATHANGVITVNSGVTKEDMAALTEATYPTLSFKAYAIQKHGFDTAALAWAEVSK